MFKETLREVVEGTDGGIAGVLMDYEGFAVETFSRDDAEIDIQTVGMELSVVLKDVRRAAEQLDAGAMQEFMFQSREALDHRAHAHQRVRRRPRDERRRATTARGASSCASPRRSSSRPSADPMAPMAPPEAPAHPRAPRAQPQPPRHPRARHLRRATLAEIDAALAVRAEAAGVAVECHQSNHEGALIDLLHGARGAARAWCSTPAGYTHTSVALRDAVAAIGIPVVECHLTNIDAREGFRRRSPWAAVCLGRVAWASAR